MAMAEKNEQMVWQADDEAAVWLRASECIKKCDAAGGVTCSIEGIRRVASAMLKLCEQAAKPKD